jgi:hypothetical protein
MTPCNFIFFGADSGYVYKIDATSTTNPPAVTALADTRRYNSGSLVCTTPPGDAVNATPAVALYAFADPTPGTRGAAFIADINSFGGGSHAGDDVVLVITSNGCSDTTRNRIIAYWASDMSQKWIFNADGSVKLDRAAQGCEIDYQNMWLFCGTDLQNPVTGQNSLFVLDIITGQLIWSTNAGAIINRPMLNYNTGRLYVVNKPGSLWAFDRAGNGLGGAKSLWSNNPLPIASTGSIISIVPWVEPRGGTWQNRILAVDSAGVLHAICDGVSSPADTCGAGTGSVGTRLWDLTATGGATFRSEPNVVPDATQSKAYISRDDGYSQMLYLDDRSPSIHGVVTLEGATPTNVGFDGAMDLDSLGNPTQMVVIAGTTLNRLQVPYCTSTGYGAASCSVGGLGGSTCAEPQNYAQYNPCLDITCQTNNCKPATTSTVANTFNPPNAGNGNTPGAVPNGTPCDDNWTGAPVNNGPRGACTYSSLNMFTSSNGTVFTPKCFGGTNNGNVCTTNADCLAGGTCNGGTRNGLACTSNDPNDATNGCPVDATHAGWCHAATGGGTAASCTSNATCGVNGVCSGSCTGGGTCLGAACTTATGAACTTFYDCINSDGGTHPGVRCVLGHCSQGDTCYPIDPSRGSGWRDLQTNSFFCNGTKCVCNNGSGVNCNDVCQAGTCTHDTYFNCACTNQGDLGCSAGTCCGSCTAGSTCGSAAGGCVDLYAATPVSPAFHCGDCNTDCNTYFTPVPAVNCTTDGTCTAQANGSCAFSATTITCSSDADCGTVCAGATAGKCSSNNGSTVGFCNCGQCRYMTQAGTCFQGVCTNFPACTAPSISDLAAFSQKGADSLAFSNSATCDAYVTNYRSDLVADAACGAGCTSDPTCGAGNKCTNGFCCPEGKACVAGTCRYASMQKISSGGTVSYFTIMGDVGRLNGVGVLRAGMDAFGSFVNDPANTLAAGFSRANGTTYGRPLSSSPTNGAANQPFAASEFNQGPVGPAVDTATSTDTSWSLYLGNFIGGGCAAKIGANCATAGCNLCQITGNGNLGSGTASAVTWSNQPCTTALSSIGICTHAPTDPDVNPERITAIAFGQLYFTPPRIFHRFLIIAHGTTLSFLDLDGGSPAQKDLDLTNPVLYNPTTPGAVARGESAPTAILSVAVSPYGDLVIEVRGTTPNRFILNLDAHDQSGRHQRVVQHDQVGFGPCDNAGHCPTAKNCVEGFCLDDCSVGCPGNSTCKSIGTSCQTAGTLSACCPNNAVPNNFGANDGRLTVGPDGQLIRFVPQVNLPPTFWNSYRLTK